MALLLEAHFKRASRRLCAAHCAAVARSLGALLSAQARDLLRACVAIKVCVFRVRACGLPLPRPLANRRTRGTNPSACVRCASLRAKFEFQCAQHWPSLRTVHSARSYGPSELEHPLRSRCFQLSAVATRPNYLATRPMDANYSERTSERALSKPIRSDPI